MIYEKPYFITCTYIFLNLESKFNAFFSCRDAKTYIFSTNRLDLHQQKNQENKKTIFHN